MAPRLPSQSEPNLLQRSHLVRSIAYLGAMVAILEISYRTLRQLRLDELSFHQAATPAVALVTYAFARLRPEDRLAWQRLPDSTAIAQFGQGLAVGGATITALLAVAAAKGWVSAPHWGWEQHAPAAVAASIAVLTLQQAMVVWNEEIVFRGYGFDTLRQAVGLPAALLSCALLFAVYHGLDPRRVVSMALAGITLALMRLESGGLWLPYGFHLAWNLVQVVVFGPVAESPSIRPLHVHGPADWIGQPGHPEPGWLSMIVMAILAATFALRLWRRQRR